MGVYKISENKLLDIRNKIFVESGISALSMNGFIKSPFSTGWFGKNNLGSYTYELCKVAEDSHLEFIVTHISKGDNWIKTFLNIFKLYPKLESIQQLDGIDGLQYHLPPNSLTKMRLGIDDIKGIPLFSYRFMFKGHKINSFKTESGLNKRIEELSSLINEDLSNINYFVKRWYQLHKPISTTWEGMPINKEA